jgi:hypothetical protein
MNNKVYTFGSADPRVIMNYVPPKKSPWKRFLSFFKRKKKANPSLWRGYSSFSGIDLKPYFEYRDGTIEVIAEIQAISWAGLDSINGEIISIVFDRSNLDNLKGVKNIYLVACTEYGSLSAAILREINIVDYSYGISIDDIVSKEHIYFEANEYIPFQPWKVIGQTEESRKVWLAVDDIRYKHRSQNDQ